MEISADVKIAYRMMSEAPVAWKYEKAFAAFARDALAESLSKDYPHQKPRCTCGGDLEDHANWINLTENIYGGDCKHCGGKCHSFKPITMDERHSWNFYRWQQEADRLLKIGL